MKHFASRLVSLLIVAAAVFNSYAEIPEGIWYKTDGVITNDLKIFFNHPEKMDGKLFYGSYSDAAGSAIWYYKFGKPVISGNTAQMKAYLYVDYLDDEDGMMSSDSTEDCTVTYDESSKQISFCVSGEEMNIFDNSDRCSLVVCNGNNVNIRESPLDGEKIDAVGKGFVLPLTSIVSAPGNGEIWYEVGLPSDKKGYVSGKYFLPLPEKQLVIPDYAFSSSYEHLFKGILEKKTFQSRSISRERKMM